MHILWIDPVGTDVFSPDMLNILNEARRKENQVDVVSLADDRPNHLEYHAYEGLVVADIIRLTYKATSSYDAVVIGDQRKYLTALIMVDDENVMKYAQDNRVPFTTYASLTKTKEVKDLIQKEVDRANKKFARVETIKKFRLIDIQLTTDDEEITPTGKLKRNFVSKKFRAEIESMY